MGGFGSGGQWRSKKDVVEQYLKLDARKLNRPQFFGSCSTLCITWANGSSITIAGRPNSIELRYTFAREQISYQVGFETTRCHFGGVRYWFRCPGCSRRVATLFGGRYFACSCCHQLGYSSQREDLSDRAARRADRIRKRLGWEEGFLNFDGEKPKGMHWRTFDHLSVSHDRWVRISCIALAEKIAPHLAGKIARSDDPRSEVESLLSF